MYTYIWLGVLTKHDGGLCGGMAFDCAGVVEAEHAWVQHVRAQPAHVLRFHIYGIQKLKPLAFK